jgi:integrase
VTDKATLWSYSVGMLPHRVLAFEDPARKLVVYLRWRVAGDWKRKSLKFTVRTPKGTLDKDAVKRAQQAADGVYARLVSGGVMPKAPQAELTIAEGWTLATDPQTGKWPEDTAHRREMERAMNRAKSTWGARTSWNAIDRGELRKLWRTELKRARALGHDGVRSTEVIIARVMAVANWLRDEQKLALTACLSWKAMKDEMRTDFAKATHGRHEVQRLRFTAEEYRALLAAAPSVDPRWALLLSLGAEYRLGQVKRVRRSDIDLEQGRVLVRGAGKKRGTVIVLTKGQRAQFEAAIGAGGYLAGLEQAYTAKRIDDYPLFPGLRLPVIDGVVVTRKEHASRPELDNTALRTWMLRTEKKARVDGKPITHVPGRGWYGLRRAAVDAAKAAKISREGLQAHGGWSDAQIPDTIYADQQAGYAQQEAADVRAKIRGEALEPSADQNGARTQNGPANAEPSTDPQPVEES